MHLRLRLDGVQNAGAARHRSGMPVLQKTACRQHDREFGVGCLVRRQHLGRGHAAAPALGREAVAENNLAAGACLVGAGIGHRALVEKPLPGDAGERGHDHPHLAEDVARMRVVPVEPHAARQFLNDPPVLAGVAGRADGLPAHLDAAVGVGDRAVLLRKGGGRQDDIGEGGGFGHEDVLDHKNVEIGKRRAGMRLIRIRHRRVLPHDVHRPDVAVIGGVGDLDHGQAALRIELGAPEIGIAGAGFGIGHRLVVGEEHRDQPGVGRALHVVLAAQRVKAGAGTPDIARQKRQRDQAARIVGAVGVLRNSHAPEDHRASGGGIAAGNLAQNLGLDSADRRHRLGRGVGGADFQLLEPFGLGFDIGAVIKLLGDDDVDHRVQHRDIASRGEAERGGGVAVEMLAARVENIEPRSGLRRVLDEGCRHRVVHRRVGADDDDRFGVAAFGERRRDGT